MSWTARTERRKDRGNVNIRNMGVTEDAARRRFADVATQATVDIRPVAAARLSERPRSIISDDGRSGRERDGAVGLGLRVPVEEPAVELGQLLAAALQRDG